MKTVDASKHTFKEVTVHHLISYEQARNLLVSALEGGSNYWMFLLKYEFPHNTNREDFIEGGQYALKDEVCNSYWPIAYVLPFIPGGGIVLEDKQEDNRYTLTREKMLNGLSIMAEKYPKHFRDIVDENDDAETADVFLQCSLFSEIVYG